MFCLLISSQNITSCKVITHSGKTDEVRFSNIKTEGDKKNTIEKVEKNYLVGFWNSKLKKKKGKRKKISRKFHFDFGTQKIKG